MRQLIWSCAALAAGLTFISIEAPEAGAAIPPYQLVGQFSAPAGTNAFDTLPDGRVLFVAGTQLLAADVRTGVPASALGSVPAGVISSFGASFVAVSPDGSTIALGDNNFGSGASVVLVRTADLSTGGASAVRSVACPNQEAAWSDGRTLYVSGFGSGPVVTRVDTGSLVPAARTVVSGIGDGSGGVAIGAGRLFVGLGFDAAGGSTTGQVRAFDLAAIESGAGPSAFVGGTLVARALSAGSLGLDAGGNLLAGGGDFFSGSGDFGSAAVIDGAGIARALGGGPIDPIAAQLRLSPAGASAFYAIKFNGATQELLVGDGATIFRYAVPGPGAAWVAILGAGLASRRRRHG